MGFQNEKCRFILFSFRFIFFVCFCVCFIVWLFFEHVGDYLFSVFSVCFDRDVYPVVVVFVVLPDELVVVEVVTYVREVLVSCRDVGNADVGSFSFHVLRVACSSDSVVERWCSES